MTKLGMIINFNDQTLEWDQSYINMKDMDVTIEELYFHSYESEPKSIKDSTQRVKDILDAKYAKTDIDLLCKQCNYLSQPEQNGLEVLLSRFEHLFDGALGTWKHKPHDIE